MEAAAEGAEEDAMHVMVLGAQHSSELMDQCQVDH